MKRAVAFALVLCVAIILPAEAGHAGDSFRFFGSGWGHGLGMSQYGAYGLAKQGWGQARILTHFYSGTKVAPAASPPGKLRVGLVQGKQKMRLAPTGGPADLRLGDPNSGQVVATVPDGETWTVQVAGQAYRILDGTGSKVGEDVGGPTNNLYVAYGNGARV
ncbi:MAG TPA: hypothetical protein VGK11_05495, partial [Actinomycetota bacterium]